MNPRPDLAVLVDEWETVKLAMNAAEAAGDAEVIRKLRPVLEDRRKKMLDSWPTYVAGQMAGREAAE